MHSRLIHSSSLCVRLLNHKKELIIQFIQQRLLRSQRKWIPIFLVVLSIQSGSILFGQLQREVPVKLRPFAEFLAGFDEAFQEEDIDLLDKYFVENATLIFEEVDRHLRTSRRIVNKVDYLKALKELFEKNTQLKPVRDIINYSKKYNSEEIYLICQTTYKSLDGKAPVVETYREEFHLIEDNDTFKISHIMNRSRARHKPIRKFPLNIRF